MPDPFRELASIIDARISEKMAHRIAGIGCEIGVITATGLKLDSFSHEIQQYMLADWLVKLHLPEFTLVGTESGLVDGEGRPVTGTATWLFEETEIDGVRLELQGGLQPGDRVLTVPVNGGRNAVVIAKVIPNA